MTVVRTTPGITEINIRKMKGKEKAHPLVVISYYHILFFYVAQQHQLMSITLLPCTNMVITLVACPHSSGYP